jgi:hypothetical protein
VVAERPTARVRVPKLSIQAHKLIYKDRRELDDDEVTDLIERIAYLEITGNSVPKGALQDES